MVRSGGKSLSGFQAATFFFVVFIMSSVHTSKQLIQVLKVEHPALSGNGLVSLEVGWRGVTRMLGETAESGEAVNKH